MIILHSLIFNIIIGEKMSFYSKIELKNQKHIPIMFTKRTTFGSKNNKQLDI